MSSIAGNAASALQIAGSLSGVPYVGAAAMLAHSIITNCEQIAGQKRRCCRLVDKCTKLLLAFQDQTSRLAGTELQEVVDEVTAVLEKVSTRVESFSRYSRVAAFLKKQDIQDGLDQCESDVADVMNEFNLHSHILLHQLHLESTDQHRSDTVELRDLLHQILISAQDLRNIVEIQRTGVAGEHIAEDIMRAGQLELRQLREAASSDMHELMVAETLTTSPPPEPRDGERYLQYQRGLITLHRTTGIPPSVKRLDGEVTKTGDLAIAGGTYSDIWLGMWLGEEKVALKSLRNIKAVDPKAHNRFEREIKIWASLRHEHILPFYGIVTNLGQNIHMVSPWQENGNVLEYVEAHNDAHRIVLLSGAAQGVAYLHSRDVIHGNLKCANILVSASGKACICDFGMSTVIEDVTEKSASATLTTGGSARWLAPEVIDGSIPSPTMRADTYSYAMAILELLTMKHPYADRRRDASVIHDVVVLKRTPSKPQDPNSLTWLTDDLWSLMQECWHRDAKCRPSMKEAAARMKAMEE